MAKLTIKQVLQQAVDAHKAGRSQEAHHLYAAILKVQPKHPDANHNTGLLTVGFGKIELALPFFKTALDANPSNAQFWYSHIVALIKLERLIDAKVLLDQAKSKGIKGADFDQLEQRLNEANKALSIKPNNADGFYNMGIALQKQNKLEEAIEAYNKALAIKPDNANAYSNMGIALKDQGKLEEAIEAYNKALAIKPDNADAYSNMGIALQKQNKLEEAIEAYNKALAIKPDNANAYYNMGIVLKEQNKLVEAIKAYNKAIAIKPDDADAYNNMGIALKDQGKLEEAIEAYNKALSIKPDNADAYNNMGNALKDQDKLEEAVEAYNKALSIKPDNADAYNNMGNALKDQDKLEEAIKAYNNALIIKPDYADAHHNLSFALLINGRLKDGLEEYEWRLRKKKRTADPARTNFIWDGKQSLNNKRFVTYEEQGLGDIIQFCRYLPFLEQRGADVSFKVKPALHALLQTLDSDVTLSTTYPDETQIDFEAPLMSLPHLFKTHLKIIPSTIPYLYANRDRTKTWGERLRTDRFKIGICWQGSKTKVDVGRSFPLSLFEGISKAPNVELISLHKGEGEHQIESINFDLTTLGADFDFGDDAFLDTAAVMMNCDLIITSDTAVAHLAGSLGCQTWVALKHVPDWRWMLDRSDSPWYSTMTLYRQKTPGDWACVFDAINRNLHILIDQRGQ
ncbi:tetratricopeptide repeat protein [Amylibacter sp.]|nr:tetratricopeptide repeat protein [Amylibacter sp.]